MSLGLRSYCAHRGVEVRATTNKGRGVFASKNFKPGDVIMETEAISHHFISAFAVCHYCLQTTERMHRCSACKFAKYCSAFCQKEAWTTHRSECRDLVAFQQKSLPLTPELILTYRTLKAYVEMPAKTKIAVTDPTGRLPYCREDIDILCSNIQHCLPPQRVAWGVAAKIMLEETKITDVSREFVVELYCKNQCNAFNITDDQLFTIGSGLYPFSALINHSCMPNCITMYENTRQIVRAACNIQAGTELSVTYLDICDKRSNRQRELKLQYYFDCRCERCIEAGLKSNGLPSLDASIAPEDVGMACPAPERAAEAQRLYDEAFKKEKEQALRDAFELLQKARQLSVGQLYAEDLRLLQVNSRIVSLATALEEWNAGAEASRDLVAQYAAIYGQNHPMTGLQFLSLGRLLIAAERTEEAKEALNTAKRLLTLSHGADHPIFRQQRELLSALDEHSNSNNSSSGGGTTSASNLQASAP